MKTTEMNELEKILVMGDIHGEFVDDRALDLTINYVRRVYKPDTIILNGDIVDFYGISRFDKDPLRKDNLQYELDITKKLLTDLRKYFPTAKIYYLKGNHEERLKANLSKNPEFSGLTALKLENLLDFRSNKINYVKATSNYWKKDPGHLMIGDVVIMHGDNRLNGAKGGKYASINTMININHNTVINHTHKLGVNYYSNSYVNLFAINSGCLCQIAGMADFHQGFSTFEINNGKACNPRTYRINDGVMIVDGKKFTTKKKIKNKI